MYRTLLRAAMLVLAGIVTVAWPAAAMSCKFADPWFVERVALSEPLPTFPEGVSVRVVSGRAPGGPVWDDAAANWIELDNVTPMPLYLLVRAETFQKQMGYERISWPDDDLGGLAGELNAYLKVESNVAYDWPYNCAVVRCQSVGWLPRQQPIVVSDGLWGISPGFEQRNVYKRDRPSNVTIPPPQSATMTLGYAGKLVAVPFVVTYELNPSYDPSAGTNPGECGSGLGIALLGLLIALIAGVSGAVILLTKLVATVARLIH